jgi:hypothetical protein
MPLDAVTSIQLKQRPGVATLNKESVRSLKALYKSGDKKSTPFKKLDPSNQLILEFL